MYKKQDKNEFYKADLHIHTPKSECFKEKDIEEQYIKILKKAKEEKISVIGITDHNTIEGYKEILNIQKNLIKQINSATISKKEKNKIDKELLLFKDLLILPGIEFETQDCVHILVLFNETTDPNLIENFLIDGGYKREQFGKESPSFLAKWTVLDLFEETKKYDCIVIDAHTDSDKGIYSLPKNKYRANCFKSEQLTAISYKKETQKDKLDSIIKNNLEYKRNKPIAFIKASDAHEINSVGSERTWIRLKELNFESLKAAFNNPIENISIEPPNVKTILEKLINADNTLFCEDFQEDNILNCKKYICALNNTAGGHILFGVTESKNKEGILINKNNIKEDIQKYFDIIISTLKEINGKVKLSFNPYRASSNKIIIALNISYTEILIDIVNDEKIYFYKSKKVYPAKAEEIQKIVEERQLDYLKNNLIKKIEILEKECFLIKTIFNSIPLTKKFEQNSHYFTEIISKTKVLGKSNFNKSLISKIRDLRCRNSNGQADGNIIILNEKMPPRLNYAYLRITVPAVKIEKIKEPVKDSGDIIYFIPGGAIFYSKNDLLSFYENNFYILKVLIDKHYPNVKFIVSFLKSSFFLWYILNKFNSMDLLEGEVFENIRIPKLNFDDINVKNYIKNIVMIFDDIIKKENDFLAKESIDCKLIEQFNLELENNFFEIDKIIYKLLQLNNNEIELIENSLKANNVFYPKRLIGEG